MIGIRRGRIERSAVSRGESCFRERAAEVGSISGDGDAVHLTVDGTFDPLFERLILCHANGDSEEEHPH
jgi:hypothetical protein